MPIEPGQVLGGKYRIVRLLGEGGMGAVYEGENARIHRRVAIKVLHTSVASNADVVMRFEREAQAAGRIGSKHIVEVLDLGELEDGTRYMVLEFLEGTTLSDRIESRGRLTPEDATPILVQLLEGLGAAHAAQIIHRDLKPANVFLLANKAGQADFVKILDFGVSKFSVLTGGEESMSMTKTGAVMGTPFYMSPEQAKGARHIDARSDLYTVGVILYECMTGQMPFNAETFNELMFKIVLEAPQPPEAYVPDLDPGISAIIRKAMAREPADRYQTAAEFQQALRDRPNVPADALPQGPVGTPAAVVRALPTPPRGTPALDESIVIPKRSSAPLFAAVIAGGVVLGGAVFGVTRWSDGPAAPAAPSAEPGASAHLAPPAPDATASATAGPQPAVTPAPVESATAPPPATATARASGNPRATTRSLGTAAPAATTKAVAPPTSTAGGGRRVSDQL